MVTWYLRWETPDEPNNVDSSRLAGYFINRYNLAARIRHANPAASIVQRAVTRVTEAKLKDSAGASVGWELHNGIIRGENRY